MPYSLCCIRAEKTPSLAQKMGASVPPNSFQTKSKASPRKAGSPAARFFGRRVAAMTAISAPSNLEDFVKKRLHSVSFLAAVFGIISWGGLLHAQQTSPDTQSAPQTQQAPDTQTPPSQAPSRQSPDQPAQQTPSTPDQSAGQGSQAQPTDQAGGQTFTGTVVKQSDKYVLQDAATGTTYDIDHQDEVKKFEGKKVRVHGTLDASGKMIHVQ
jgi:hypothetical protein